MSGRVLRGVYFCKIVAIYNIYLHSVELIWLWQNTQQPSNKQQELFVSCSSLYFFTRLGAFFPPLQLKLPLASTTEIRLTFHTFQEITTAMPEYLQQYTNLSSSSPRSDIADTLDAIIKGFIYFPFRMRPMVDL
jgi:hypothetical protein